MFSDTARQRRRPTTSSTSDHSYGNQSRQRQRHGGQKAPDSLPQWLPRLIRKFFRVKLSWKHFMGISSLGLGVWYGTPLVSDIVVPVVLELAVPVSADIALGQQVYQQQKLHKDTYYDSYWTPKLQHIGHELVQVEQYERQHKKNSNSVLRWLTDILEELQPAKDSRRGRSPNDFVWDFGVVDENDVVNAFALPGGIIRVTRALLQQLDLSDGELAALIGHEMGHVLHRHGAGQVLERRLLETLLQAVVYEDHDSYKESWGEALGELLLDSADWLGQRAFSRRHEYQADAMSWDLLAASQTYHPMALSSLLTKLLDHHQQREQGRRGSSHGPSGRTSWESTHPGTVDRLQALDQKWDALPRQEHRRLQRTNKVY